MKISLTWLREYVDYDGTAEDLAELLTKAGVEVEGIASLGAASLEKVVVAQVLSREQHPNADRLSVCRVDDGSGAQPPRQIVCGARNFQVGDKVPLALPGATLPGGVNIKVGKLRGVESEGMMCSAKELRLADDAEGLLILSPEAPVGAAIGDLYPNDTVLDVEITPNRGDLLSHVGLAREVAALTGKELRDPIAIMEEAPGGEPPAALPVMIAANARTACPFYSVRVIEDVTVGSSPDWLRARLESVGLRPINNVVDITNFVMLELGQPLHAFDAAHVGADGIGVRLASPGEELLALDGRTYKLQTPHLVISQGGSGKAEALAGVMGGEESGVTAKTKSIVLESAYFAPTSVRRTSRELGLGSDASYRFERGVDPGRVLAASNRAEDMILQICGGTPAGLAHTHHLSEYDPIINATEAPVTLRLSRVWQVLGAYVDSEEVSAILTRFGLEEVDGEHDDDQPEEETVWLWRVPSHRPDLRREIDLIEEVTRVYGLDEVPGRVWASFAAPSAVDALYDFQMGLRRKLVGLGFAEARSATLVRREDGTGGVMLKNPLNEENAVLRGTLLPGLLAAAGRNARQGVADLRLFELGRQFAPNWPVGQPESARLALVLSGAAFPAAWRHAQTGGTRNLDLHDLRGAVEALCAPAALELRPAEAGAAGADGLALEAALYVDGKLAGVLGQLAPGKAKALELRGDVLVAEIDVAALQAASGGAPRFRPLAKFPSVTRDLAVVVGRGVEHGQIERTLGAAREPLLAGVELFDVFTDDKGEKVAADRKSLAYSLTYRADDRTLKTEEVNAVHARLKAALKAGFDGLQFRE